MPKARRPARKMTNGTSVALCRWGKPMLTSPTARKQPLRLLLGRRVQQAPAVRVHIARHHLAGGRRREIGAATAALRAFRLILIADILLLQLRSVGARA